MMRHISYLHTLTTEERAAAEKINDDWWVGLSLHQKSEIHSFVWNIEWELQQRLTPPSQSSAKTTEMITTGQCTRCALNPQTCPIKDNKACTSFELSEEHRNKIIEQLKGDHIEEF